MNIKRKLCLDVSVILLPALFLIQPAAYAQSNETSQDGGPVFSASTPTPTSTSVSSESESYYMSVIHTFMRESRQFGSWFVSQSAPLVRLKDWVWTSIDDFMDLGVGEHDHFNMPPASPSSPPSKSEEESDEPKSNVSPFPTRPSRNKIDSFSPRVPKGGGRSRSSS